LFLLQVGVDTESRPSFAILTIEFAKMAKDSGSGRHRTDMNRFLVQRWVTTQRCHKMVLNSFCWVRESSET